MGRPVIQASNRERGDSPIGEIHEGQMRIRTPLRFDIHDPPPIRAPGRMPVGRSAGQNVDTVGFQIEHLELVTPSIAPYVEQPLTIG